LKVHLEKGWVEKTALMPWYSLGFLDFKLSTEKLNKQALRVQDMIPLLMLLVVWAFGKVGPGIWALEKS